MNSYQPQATEYIYFKILNQIKSNKQTEMQIIKLQQLATLILF